LINFSCRYIASQDTLRPLCDLLSVADAKIVEVALTGIENILRAGEEAVKESNGTVVNPYAMQIEECFGLDKIEYLQQHENKIIYKKAYDIIENFFNEGDDAGIDSAVQPDSTSGSYAFGAAAATPQNGFAL